MRTGRPSLTARAVALTGLGRAYARSAEEGLDGFAARALAELDVTGAVDPDDLERIPADGPLIVVANHPFGGIDGLLLLDLLGRRRRDVKLLGNRLLHVLPALRPSLLRVDLSGRRAATARNGSTLRQAIRWLHLGRCLAVFPAGEVAHLMGPDGQIVDSPWHTTIGELSVRTGAPVLPVFFAGANSRLFRTAGRIHPVLRTALLPREMWARRGMTVGVRIGTPVPAETLGVIGDAHGRTSLLRRRVDALSCPPATSRPAASPVTSRGSAAAIEQDIRTLQRRALLESGPYQVFCAEAAALPAILPEIGRLREIAFRHAGEGSGLSRDLDRFDETYQHLFVWDSAHREIAGAYRVGATDVVAPEGRVEALYTRTLFDYGPALLGQIGPALELGRAFVQPAYQRSFSPLLLLWKGISRLVSSTPRYRRLFGLVSISDAYDTTSRQLLVQFLQTYRFDADLAALVRGRNPLPPPPDPVIARRVARTLDDVSTMVRSIERDGKDVPILLRQYLKLNAKLIGFSLDPAFGGVLDGLLVVDLAEVEPALLERFMGRAEARAYRASLRPELAIEQSPQGLPGTVQADLDRRR